MMIKFTLTLFILSFLNNYSMGKLFGVEYQVIGTGSSIQQAFLQMNEYDANFGNTTTYSTMGSFFSAGFQEPEGISDISDNIYMTFNQNVLYTFNLTSKTTSGSIKFDNVEYFHFIIARESFEQNGLKYPQFIVGANDRYHNKLLMNVVVPLMDSNLLPPSSYLLATYKKQFPFFQITYDSEDDTIFTMDILKNNSLRIEKFEIDNSPSQDDLNGNENLKLLENVTVTGCLDSFMDNAYFVESIFYYRNKDSTLIIAGAAHNGGHDDNYSYGSFYGSGAIMSINMTDYNSKNIGPSCKNITDGSYIIYDDYLSAWDNKNNELLILTSGGNITTFSLPPGQFGSLVNNVYVNNKNQVIASMAIN